MLPRNDEPAVRAPARRQGTCDLHGDDARRMDHEGMLSDERLLELHRRYADHRCPDAAAVLVERYRPQARAIARRVYRGGVPLDDLEQIATEAMLRALERFDPDRGIPFHAFAERSITGHMKHFFRDHGWTIRLPRWMHELAPQLERERERLVQELGTEPTEQQLAHATDQPPMRLEEALAAFRMRMTSVLDTDDDEGRGGIGRPDRVLEATEVRVAVREAVARLEPSDRDIVALYYGRDLTQSQIGARIGVSQMEVSRRLRRILELLGSDLRP